ncbi:hypothetical protein [Spiroplasma citri]|uniref:Uncharacterized protein n=1 Tax=Spiroplasma citri TaxID=2133 RepID=A0AAJ4JXY5_SPICI|nr:hypothetical protein [Spiroplasma citri]APE74535.1 hypothetical protein SCITRI_00639 [Spiroplasma citri]QED24437.1 hypothetical protein FRX96_03005 [Spiroplasma citri]QIA66720.1 hypothetical protein GMI18_03105 [Spiroplasma citri]QIA68593.1 hypothetical protein GL298_03155 [Spiroplasma citri]QIA70463.1 hypothetical protein GL981_03155 [Spiroplasma citri]
MAFRFITFDNTEDYLTDRDQAIYYDFLLRNQTIPYYANKELSNKNAINLLGNSDNYNEEMLKLCDNNSTGFLFYGFGQQENLEAEFKYEDNGIQAKIKTKKGNREIPFFYLSICGRMIKVENNTTNDINDLIPYAKNQAETTTIFLTIKIDMSKAPLVYPIPDIDNPDENYQYINKNFIESLEENKSEQIEKLTELLEQCPINTKIEEVEPSGIDNKFYFEKTNEEENKPWKNIKSAMTWTDNSKTIATAIIDNINQVNDFKYRAIYQNKCASEYFVWTDKGRLIQDNLNTRHKDGIYEFPILSFNLPLKGEKIKSFNWEYTARAPIRYQSIKDPNNFINFCEYAREKKEEFNRKWIKEMEKMDQKIAQLEKRIREMPYKIESSVKYVKSRLKEIAPDEKPFNQVDNKWYYVVWKKDKWEINKIFRNYNINVNQEYIIYKDNNYELKFFRGINKINKIQDTSLIYNSNNPFGFAQWGERNSDYINYIKSVYRWDGGEEWSPILAYDDERDMIKFWVWKDFKTWEKAQRGIVTTAAIGLRAFGYWVLIDKY